MTITELAETLMSKVHRPDSYCHANKLEHWTYLKDSISMLFDLAETDFDACAVRAAGECVESLGNGEQEAMTAVLSAIKSGGFKADVCKGYIPKL